MTIRVNDYIPPSVNHYWGECKGRKYLTQKGRILREILALKIKQAPKEGFFAVSITMNLKDKRRRDVDNVIKPILDAMNGRVYYDDVQVLEVSCKKCFTCKNELIIHIEQLKQKE